MRNHLLPRICCVLLVLAPMSRIAAQQADDPRALRALQDSIAAMRKTRLQLEAATERVLADSISARAKRLAMSGEVGALQKLELLLDSAQVRLTAQRDRIRVLRDGATATDQATLVVSVRADALPAGDVAAVVMVDGNQRSSVNLQPEQVKTIVAGSSDELFRGEITPVDHKVLLQLAAKGLSVGDMISVPATARGVTYVEFVLKGGRLVSTTWTNKTTNF